MNFKVGSKQLPQILSFGEIDFKPGIYRLHPSSPCNNEKGTIVIIPNHYYSQIIYGRPCGRIGVAEKINFSKSMFVQEEESVIISND